MMRILIVEDENLFAALLTKNLRPIASKIDRVSRLADCMAMIQREHYNVVILDLRLHDVDWHQTVAAIPTIKAMRPPLAVVVVSGVLEDGIESKCREAGADAFVPKSDQFTIQAIMVAINVATLPIAEETDKSDTYLQHVQMLQTLANA